MHQFDQDISFEPQQPFHYITCISDKWTINSIPHGGYLMSIMSNVVLSISEKKFISIFSASFLARCQPGSAEVIVERIASSKTFERLQIRLLQEGKEKIRALATLVGEERSGEHYREQEAPALLPVDQCFQLPEMPNLTFFSQMDIRLEPECTGWMKNRLSNRSEMRGWVKFKEKRPFDQLALAMIVDSFPPPVFASHGVAAWVPTVEFTFNLRNQPHSEWLKCIFRSRFIDSGIMDEDGEIWDETGQLIAISRQFSQFRSR